jgi:malonate decarboxylase epsilon subunit
MTAQASSTKLTRLLPELGVTVAVETQPGHVLTRLNAANAPMVQALSMQDNGIDAIVTRVRRSP